MNIINPYVFGVSYNDWFLPSEDELEQMYINLHAEGVGNFSSDNYWLSSEFDATYARFVSF